MSDGSEKAVQAARRELDAATAEFNKFKGRTASEALDRLRGRLQGREADLQASLQAGDDAKAEGFAATVAALREQERALTVTDAGVDPQRAREAARRELFAAKGRLGAALRAHFRDTFEAPALDKVNALVAAIFRELDALDETQTKLQEKYGIGVEGVRNVWLAMQGLLAALRAPPHMSPSELRDREEMRRVIGRSKDRERKRAGVA